MMQPALLSLESIEFGYGRTQVLRGVELTVRPGEVHALIGENGAGKSTLIHIALGLLAPDFGEARLFGKHATEIGDGERARLGFVGERSGLLGRMRLRSLIEFESATRANFDAEFARRRLESLGLDLRRYLQEHSNGQKAQIALGLAIAARPSFLILDDPALGLDTRTRRALLAELIELISERDVGVLLTSHLLPEVERIADRVSILAGGRITFEGPIDHIRANAARVHVSSRPDRMPPRVGEAGVLAVEALRDGWDVLLWREGPLAQEFANGAELAPVDLEEFFLAMTHNAPEEVAR